MESSAYAFKISAKNTPQAIFSHFTKFKWSPIANLLIIRLKPCTRFAFLREIANKREMFKLLANPALINEFKITQALAPTFASDYICSEQTFFGAIEKRWNVDTANLLFWQFTPNLSAFRPKRKYAAKLKEKT